MSRIAGVSFIAVLALISAGVASLFGQSADGWPRTVSDDTGARVTLARKPQRVVSLTLPTDEILLALLDTDRLAAVTSFALDPALSNVTSEARGVRTRLPQLNVEVVVSLRPDLVFVASWSDASAVRQLREAGLPVYQVRSPVTVAAIEEEIGRISAAVGEEEKGRDLVRWMRERLTAVTRWLDSVSSGRRLTIMNYTTWGSSMGRGSSWDEIVRLAGLTNGAAGLAVDRYGSVPMSREKLLELDPDLLLLPGWVYGDPSGADAFFARVAGDPALRAMKAIRQGGLLRMPERLMSCTSQFIVLAIEELARAAYSGSRQGQQ